MGSDGVYKTEPGNIAHVQMRTEGSEGESYLRPAPLRAGSDTFEVVLHRGNRLT